jgi:hypothetical protein
MIDKLYSENTPAKFWHPIVGVTNAQWQAAIKESMQVLQMPQHSHSYEALLEAILGEGQFGPNQWNLGLVKRLYYELKPLLPRRLIQKLRQSYSLPKQAEFPLGWPIEARYAQFLWAVMQQFMLETKQDHIEIKSFWPDKHRYAFILTHDIETDVGQSHVRSIMALEAELGFRSSFNFIPERYSLDHTLIRDLQSEGFEVGLHGLKHDGKLFSSRRKFDKRVGSINGYLETLNAVGFRSPLTHRHPEWMQSLNIEYDLSFFDTDPFEAISGGTMSIWPFIMGKFVELPYTLPQDYTIFEVLEQKTPTMWLEKVDFIEKYHGMALLNSHPDYLVTKENWDIYTKFLATMKNREGYWHALPKEAASWWRDRHNDDLSLPGNEISHISSVSICNNELSISPKTWS